MWNDIMKLFWNNVEIISVFYFTCNQVWNWKKELFQPLKEFWNHFKIIPGTLNVLENIHEPQEASEIILK